MAGLTFCTPIQYTCLYIILSIEKSSTAIPIDSFYERKNACYTTAIDIAQDCVVQS